VPSPFDCWLLLRSLPTLPLRVQQQSANALAVARFLASDRRVERVHYPGSSSIPAMRSPPADAWRLRCGGVVPGAGCCSRGAGVASRVRLFTRATSLGGVESLIEHRASMEGPLSRTPPNLIRLSIGLENVDDLVADLEQALGS